MDYLTVYEIYKKIFEELNYDPPLERLAKVKKLVDDYGEDITIRAMCTLSGKLLNSNEEIEDRINEFFNKLDTVAYRLTLPKWLQEKEKLLGYMNKKFASMGKDTNAVNIENLIGVLRESACDDEETMERRIKEACKLVYPAEDYIQLLNQIERLFIF